MNSKKRSIVIALMVAMFLGAVEGTVVTTAIPTIVKDLNSFQLINLVFSTYLLTSAISTPVYGKLSDLFGRKNVLCVGIIIFLIGSFLCGLSGNIYELIAFRALQGLGAGSIFTITYTIVGDIFELSERGKIQGAMSSVWGIASLIGPFLGGFLIDFLSWHWIFFINIPFGILSIVLLQKNLKESSIKQKRKIDYLGTLILTSSIMLLLYGLLSIQQNINSIFPMISFVATALLLVIFYFIEKKAEEPIVPFDIFSKTNIVVNIISFLCSAALIGADIYLTIYLQNVLGFSPTIAGLSMAPMSISWIIASTVLGKKILEFGEKKLTIFSTLLLIIGSSLLLGLNTHSPLVLVMIYSFILGAGFGGNFSILTILIQEATSQNKRGAATASNSLVRTLAQAISAGIFGLFFNSSIISYFNNVGIKHINTNNLFSLVNTNSQISIDAFKSSINYGLHVVFIVILLISTVCFALAFSLSNILKGK